MTKNKIVFAAAECAPFVKVGGLADVVGSLPKALKEIGADISVILPYYQSIKIPKKNLKLFKKKIKLPFLNKVEYFDIWQTFLPDSKVPVFLIKNNKYFKGAAYSTESPHFSPYEFEAARFLFFMRSIIETSKIIKADTIHCHDWHTSLAPLLAKKYCLKARTILTIHNIAYQGIYKSSLINKFLGTELEGTINCLQSGIENSDVITTVSPNYAKEILGPEFGFGLENSLKKRKKDLVGIINGLDPDQFNPEKDSYIKKTYSIQNINDKKDNKIDLQERCFKNSSDDVAVIGMVTRIAEQKGFDLIENIFDDLMKKELQLIVLGKGTKDYEDFLRKQAKKYPDKFFLKTEFNEEFAHQIYAGSDIFLMPSAFEPCGLGQMIAMRYGAIPVVRAVGGLKDTVEQVSKTTGTGFLFKKYDSGEFMKEIEKSLRLFKKESAWKKIQLNCMKKDFSWKTSAKKYLEIYR